VPFLARIFKRAASELRDAGGRDVSERIEVYVGSGSDLYESHEELKPDFTAPTTQEFDRIRGSTESRDARVDVILTRQPRIDSNTFSVAVLLEVRPKAGGQAVNVTKIRDGVARAIERGRPSGVREPLKGVTPPDGGPEKVVRSAVAADRSQVVFPLGRTLIVFALSFVLFTAVVAVADFSAVASSDDPLGLGLSAEELLYGGAAALIAGVTFAIQSKVAAARQREGVRITGGPRQWWVSVALFLLKEAALPLTLGLLGLWIGATLGPETKEEVMPRSPPAAP
jgi:hypothetical protein